MVEELSGHVHRFFYKPAPPEEDGVSERGGERGKGRE